MKNNFTQNSQAGYVQPHYEDAVAKLFEEYRAGNASLCTYAIQNFTKPLSWNEYTFFRCEVDMEYSNFEAVSHEKFRYLFETGQIYFLKDTRTIQSIDLLSTVQKSYETIRRSAHAHREYPAELLLKFATLARLDKADFAYAMAASLPSDAKTPPKTFTFLSDKSAPVITGYAPLELAFIDHYTIEREKAAEDLLGFKNAILERTWRVPNYPPKTNDII